MEFYSAIKKNEIMLFAGKWMELKNFMITGVRQLQKVKGHMLPLIRGSWTYIVRERESKIALVSLCFLK
jgi:hypothetical protein